MPLPFEAALRSDPPQADEPSQFGSGDTTAASPSADRAWRLLLHGLPLPREAQVLSSSQTARGALPLLNREEREMMKARGHQADHFSLDEERLCVCVWIFHVADFAATSLQLRFNPDEIGVVGDGTQLHAAQMLVKRAKAAKVLMDNTYPDTQPQDYDSLTWLAGTAIRSANSPANFSVEMAAVQSLSERARLQLQQDELQHRMTSAKNKERLRNATQLLSSGK